MHDGIEVRSSARTAKIALALALAFATSCAIATDVPDPDNVDSISEPIWNGLAYTENDSGMVNLGGCSGTLMRNNWILTAAHCVNLWLDRDFSSAPNGTHNGSTAGVTLTSAVVDPSGRLIVAGSIFVGSGSQFHLERYTATGAPDPSFGVNGVVNFDFLGSTSEGAKAVALQSDGKIVAAGYATFANTLMFGLARFTSAGVPDGTFGFLGADQVDFPGSTNEQAFALAIDSHDRAIAVGQTGSNFAVARFNSAGNPDTTFNHTGLITTDLTGTSELAVAVAIDSNGKIVVAGSAANGMGVARYNDDGSPDNTLGGNGTRVVSGGSYPRAMLSQGTKILIGAQTQQLQPAVFRLSADGSLDTSFGTSGVAKPTWPAQSGTVTSMAFAPNGAIRIAASLSSGAPQQLMGYTAISANGVLFPDRILPEQKGLSIGIPSGVGLTALAAQGGRVFMVATQTIGINQPQLSSGWFMVLQPDRTEDTTFTGAFTVKMATDYIAPDRAYLATNGDDVAMLHLPMGMLMNGSRTGYMFPGFINDPTTLLNTTVLCKGYGNSVINPDGTFAGIGTLRAGFMTVTDVGTPYITVKPLPPGYLQNQLLPGDSGGNCSVSAAGQIIGVNDRGSVSSTNPSSVLVRADRFANWAYNLSLTP